MKKLNLFLVLFCAAAVSLQAQVAGDVFKVDVTNGQANFVIVKHDKDNPSNNEVHLCEIWGNGIVTIPATVQPTGDIQSSETYKVTATEGWNTIVQDKNVTGVKLPEGLTTINGGSFQYVDNSVNFNAIYLPSTLTAIGTRCFEGSLITRFYFPQGNNTYELDGMAEYHHGTDEAGEYSPAIYKGNTLVLLAAGYGKDNTTTDNVHNDGNKINGSDYTIRIGTTKIEKTAINHAAYLRKLTIPYTVTDIQVGQHVGDASIISSGTYFEFRLNDNVSPDNPGDHKYFTDGGVLFAKAENANMSYLVAVPKKYTDIYTLSEDYVVPTTIDVKVQVSGTWYTVTLPANHVVKYEKLAYQKYLKPEMSLVGEMVQAKYIENFYDREENVYVCDGSNMDTYFSATEKALLRDELRTLTGVNDLDYNSFQQVQYASIDFPRPGKNVFEFKVPEGVTAIASDAIIGVKYLEEIDLGPTTETVSNYAIAQMGGLKKVDIEEHTTDIKEGAIVECSGIEAFWVADGNAYYTHDVANEGPGTQHYGVLYTKAPNDRHTVQGENLKLYPNGRTEPTSYVVYDNTKIIEKQAFKGNKYITELTIPVSVEEIHEEACRRFGLETETTGHEVKLNFDAENSKLRLIEMNAFKESYFTAVHIPKSVETIQNNAFEAMPILKTVSFEDGCVIKNAKTEESTDFAGKPVSKTVEGLGVAAFRNNPQLESITFGSTPNLTILTNNSFSGDSVLKSITLPTSLVQIGPNALQAAGGKFINDGNLDNITEINLNELTALRGIGRYAFAGSNIGKSIDLDNDKLREIGSQAFDHCRKMEDIKLPHTLWYVADGAFTFCTSLKSIDVIIDDAYVAGGDSICQYVSIDGMLCTSDKEQLHTFPGGKTDTDYALLPYVKYVRDYAFYGCQELTSIVFPKTIESLGFRSLAKCKNLKTISFMGDWDDYEGDENSFLRLNDANTFGMTSSDDPEATPLSENISINVRQNWAHNWFELKGTYSTPENNPLLYYTNKFKEVIPSFYKVGNPGEDYDRDLEFYALSDTEVGVIGMKKTDNGGTKLRRSVIVKDNVLTPSDYKVYKKDGSGNIKEESAANRNYGIKAIMDFAFAGSNTLNTVIVLPEIDYIGAKAFVGAEDVDRIFLAGNTTVPRFVSETLEMNGQYYEFYKGSNDSIKGYHLKYNSDKDFYPFDNTVGSGLKVKIYCRPSISADFKAYADRSEEVTIYGGTVSREHKPLVDHRVPRGTSAKFSTICYPFGVQLPMGKENNDIKPFLPLEYLYDKQKSDSLVLVRARSIDDYYVPAYKAVLLYSKNGDIAAFDNEVDANLEKTDEASTGYFLIAEDNRDYCTFDPEPNGDDMNSLIGDKYKETMSGTVEHTTVSLAGKTYYYMTKQGKFAKLKKDNYEFPYFLGFLMFDGNQYEGKTLKFVFDIDGYEDGNTTGIDQIDANETTGTPVYYNLQGQRVDHPQKGIYIVNGKKVVLK